MKDNIRDLLKEALDDVAPMLTEPVAYTDNLILWGEDGIFDSMILVSFISSVEEAIEAKFNKEVTIVSEKAFSKEHSPFKTMATFGNFIDELLTEA
jgi:acyl carrier protein